MTPQQQLEQALASGRSRADLAAAIGVSRSFLSAVLRGRKRPGRKILAYLGMERYEGYRPAKRSRTRISAP